MAFDVNWVGLPAAVGGSLAIVLAVIVYRSRPESFQNQMLGLTLLSIGVFDLLYFGVRPGLTAAADAYAIHLAASLAATAWLAAYLLFVSTLPTPWVRPLRRRGVRIGAVVAAAALAADMIVYHGRYVPALGRWQHLDGWGFILGERQNTLLVAMVLALAVGLLAAITALRHARTPLQRSQLRLYTAGFVINDTIMLAGILVLGVGRLSESGTLAAELINFLFLSTGNFFLVIFLSYGILKTQLFDIDLKLKVGLRQSTVAAIIVATAFVVSELAAELLSERIGPILGILAAGALVLAIAPLQRFAERVSDAALPNVRDDADYIRVRKADVYMAALEHAMMDGTITAKEEEVLRGLQLELGISNQQVAALRAQAADGEA